MKRNIIWLKDASDDLFDIVSWIKEKTGKSAAVAIYGRILTHVENLSSFPETGRVVPELKNLGVIDIREIIEPPCRIFYRTTADEIRIMSVIDGRRNVEEILYVKMIDGKRG